MNKVFLTGNITRDVEVKQTQSGKAYARASIAVNRQFSKDKDAADFVNLLAWEKTAEFMGKWTPKGTRVLVEGRIQMSKYKDKDGNERTGFDVVVENIEFAGGKKDSDNRNVADTRNNRKSDNYFGGEDIPDEDTPF